MVKYQSFSMCVILECIYNKLVHFFYNMFLALHKKPERVCFLSNQIKLGCSNMICKNHFCETILKLGQDFFWKMFKSQWNIQGRVLKFRLTYKKDYVNLSSVLYQQQSLLNTWLYCICWACGCCWYIPIPGCIPIAGCCPKHIYILAV